MIKEKLFLFDDCSERRPPLNKVDLSSFFCKKDLHRYVCDIVYYRICMAYFPIFVILYLLGNAIKIQYLWDYPTVLLFYYHYEGNYEALFRWKRKNPSFTDY